MDRYSREFATALAVIAAKAARFTQGAWTDEECAAFAWFSCCSEGDASIDVLDFGRHMTAYINEEDQG